MSVHRIRRRLSFVTLALLLAVSVFTAQPRRAAALTSHTISGSFDVSSIPVNSVAMLTLEVVTTPVTSPYLSVGFPEGASHVGTSTDCQNFTLGPIDGGTGAGGQFLQTQPTCTIDIIIQFDTGGTFTNADFDIALSLDGSPLTTTQSGVAINITVVGGEASTPAFCEANPDMAVSPQFINLAPGGRATVEVAMRNLCTDAPTVPGDLLLSFSDGLSVVATSSDMLNLGQRASAQSFSLAPGELRNWTVTVEAAEALVVAAEHVTEHYVGGRVVNRIDGVFITPPAAPAETAVPVVAVPVAEPAAPAVPAAPVSLPNTAGSLGSIVPQLALALSLAAGGLTLRRKG